MNAAEMIRDLSAKLAELKREAARVRVGVVTDISPLSVALGGSDVPYIGAERLSSYAPAVDDVVATLMFRNDLIVLGTLSGGHRTVSGLVVTPTTVSSGGGFSVVKNGTGDYSFTYDEAFPDDPVVSAMPNGSAAEFRTISTSETGCRVTYFNSAGAASDPSAIHFLAVGPA